MRLTYIPTFCVLILLFLVSFALPGPVASEPARRPSSQSGRPIVLVLESFQQGNPIPDSVVNGLIASFQASKHEQDLYIVHLNLVRASGSGYRTKLSEMLHAEFQDKKIGMVIIQGTPAARFLVDKLKDLCPEVVMAITVPDLAPLRELHRKLIVAPWRVDPAGTLRAALAIFPKTRRVFVVTGAEDSLLPFLKEARQAFLPWQGKLDFEYSNHMTYEEMLKRSSSLPPNTIILYSPFFIDAAGRSFVPAEVVKQICRTADSPVFATLEPYLGSGIVGGSLLRTEDIGKVAGKAALAYLGGRVALHTPVTILQATCQKMFDFLELKRWGADFSRLPEGSVVVNTPKTLWGQYRAEVIAAAMTFSVLTGFVVLLFIMNTRLKRSSDAARESEARFRAIFDSIPEAVLLADGDRRILLSNPSFTRSFGYEAAEVIGRTTEFLYADPADYVEQGLLRFGKGKDNDGVPYEMSYRRKDGSVFQAESIAAHVLVKDGAPLGLMTIHRDITESKLATAALQESEKVYRDLFNNTQVAMFRTRLDGSEILNANEKFLELFGWNREEIIGGPSVVHWADPAQRDEMVRRLKAEGRVVDFECKMLNKQAELRDCIVSLSLYREEAILIGSIMDVTGLNRAKRERDALQEQLNQAQRLESVGRLAGGVAHDFNNMLGVILGHAELAMQQLDPEDSLLAALTEIRKAAARSADLTKQLLAFARRQTIAPRVLDLNETVEGTLNMLRRLIGEDIALAWLPAPSAQSVRVDPSQIDQLLTNLCVNARDAISGIGNITIETGAACFDDEYCTVHSGFIPGEFVMLAVSDDGLGMDRETLGKIFEPFYTTKGVGEGTGLGLSTVYGIVKQNNGFINVYSEPGQGTTFKIYLPRAESENSENSPAPPARDLRGKETVLLVEDEEPLLVLGKTILQRHGYEVLTTNSPMEALRMVQEYSGPVHLLITDVVMPEMNGKDLRDKLVILKPDLKGIFMSGYTANVIAHHGILDEGVSFLQKPFSVQALLEKVRDVLDG